MHALTILVIVSVSVAASAAMTRSTATRATSLYRSLVIRPAAYSGRKTSFTRAAAANFVSFDGDDIFSGGDVFDFDGWSREVAGGGAVRSA